jgi:hypothetical protein
MHPLTLTFENEELEMRWTYNKIRRKKPMMFMGLLYINYLNLSVVYPHWQDTFLLQNIALISCQIIGCILMWLVYYKDQDALKGILEAYNNDVNEDQESWNLQTS